MTPDTRGYHLAFSHAPGIGPLRFRKLIEVFGCATAAYAAPSKGLEPILGSRATEEFDRFRNTFPIDKVMCEYENRHIVILAQDDPHFPNALKEMTDCPICLYALTQTNYSTDLNELGQQVVIAVVGSRKHSQYGADVAYRLTYELARSGCVIVSGLALGIDAIAHSACLDAQGKTIGVLGCGVDVTYPRQNELLRKRILESNGILLSEFTPGTKPLPGYFVARNRIVAGLARGVLVVEGSAHSGTLTTASFAAHLGKDVFAIPGQITNTLAKAPHILLKQGAKIVTEVSDILNEYQLANRKILKEVNHSFNECEQKILSALSVEALHADDLAQKLHEDITTIISSLTTLELEDLVKKRDDGSYTTTCR